jgi:hypothetical protein
MYKFYLLYAFIAFTIPAISNNVQAESDPVYIIANKSFKLSSISKSDLQRIFKKEKSRISGIRVIPINAKSDTKLRTSFLQKALNMTPSDEITYWEKQKVTKGIQPPSELSNTVKAVFSIKNGISYCFKSQYKSSAAKILLVL